MLLNLALHQSSSTLHCTVPAVESNCEITRWLVMNASPQPAFTHSLQAHSTTSTGAPNGGVHALQRPGFTMRHPSPHTSPPRLAACTQTRPTRTTDPPNCAAPLPYVPEAWEPRLLACACHVKAPLHAPQEQAGIPPPVSRHEFCIRKMRGTGALGDPEPIDPVTS